MDLITSAFIFKSNESFELSNAMEQGMTLLGMGNGEGTKQLSNEIKKIYTPVIGDIFFLNRYLKGIYD